MSGVHQRPTALRRRTALVTIAGLVSLGALVATAPSVRADGGGTNGTNGKGEHSHKVEHPTVEGGRGRSPQPAAGAAGSGQLTYGGGVAGIGVTTGAPKVYLVFWGAGWGTQGTDGSGNVTLSGDTKGEAPLLQRFFKGLGTNSELWSGVMTQYCEGVSVGTVTCPSSAPHVGYPGNGTTLAGVWVDPSTTAITTSGSTASSPVDHDIAAEAILAAAHFGNLTGDANRNAQYVILSPTGTHPGGFNTPQAGWCAWHDYNGDTTLVGGAAASSYGSIAFTNMPYVTDMGASCGANYVNAGTAGALDGVTIVEGHEYAETITDQNPAGGWTDSAGYENADKCSWIGKGGTGGAQNITLATGSFAIQGTWSNDGATCLVAHSVVTTGVATPGVVNGGFESATFSGWSRSGTTSITTTRHSGSYAAMAGTTRRTNGDSSIVQTFTASGSQLSFWYRVRCGQNVGVDWATATLKDNTTGTTTTVLPRTCTNTSTWVQVTAPLTAGGSYTLTLTNHDNNSSSSGAYTYTLFDDVTG